MWKGNNLQCNTYFFFLQKCHTTLEQTSAIECIWRLTCQSIYVHAMQTAKNNNRQVTAHRYRETLNEYFITVLVDYARTMCWECQKSKLQT